MIRMPASNSACKMLQAHQWTSSHRTAFSIVFVFHQMQLQVWLLQLVDVARLPKEYPQCFGCESKTGNNSVCGGSCVCGGEQHMHSTICF